MTTWEDPPELDAPELDVPELEGLVAVPADEALDAAEDELAADVGAEADFSAELRW